MENKTITKEKTPWAVLLERSPSFKATFTYVSHRFDSTNKWINCKSNRNSYILFNVGYQTDKLAELGLERGDKITITFKAINRDSDRPSCYKFTAVDINRYTEVERTKDDEEVAKIVFEGRDAYEQRRDFYKATMNSHKGTFIRAVQDKRGVRCDLYFDMKVRQENGEEVITPMAFRTYCSEYFDLGFKGREGKDFRLWINAGKTSFFFSEDGEDNLVHEEKGEDVSIKYFPALFLEAAEEIKD